MTKQQPKQEAEWREKIREFVRNSHCRYCDPKLTHKCEDDIEADTDDLLLIIETVEQEAKEEERKKIYKALHILANVLYEQYDKKDGKLWHNMGYRLFEILRNKFGARKELEDIYPKED